MLEIRLLGAFEAHYKGKPLEGLQSSGPQRLLAHVLLEPEIRRSRRRLAFTMWPDSTEKQAFTNLRNALHRLRSALPAPDEVLEVDRTIIALQSQPELQVDVWRFDRACDDEDWVEAVEVYGGELLPGFYDEWVLVERDRLNDRFLRAIDQLAEWQDRRGELRSAVATTRKLLRQDPLHEPSYRRLMHLYQRLGDRASAVAAYRSCVDVLREELGTDVSPETKAAYQDLISAEQLAIFSAESGDVTAPEHNLPAPLSGFIGREQVLADLSNRLERARLLTLTGPAGVGKTRLALEFARRELAGFRDGVWWVDLSSLTSQDQILVAAANALGLRSQASEPLPGRIVEFLQAKELLLLLDNCEHLLEPVQRRAAEWLRQVPGLKILSTSREPLHLPGEAVQLVEPLSLPPAAAGTPEAVAESEASRLFVERASSLLPTFKLEAANASAVVEICRRLDGIPLAIELAAGQIRALSAPEIAARLDKALTEFGLMASAAGPGRQRTLRGAVDWSYQLLDDRERALFRQLAVFAGGWTLEAAEQVAAAGLGPRSEFADHGVLPTLSSLLEKSLVYVANREGMTRYAILEIVRQFARQRLNASGGEATARQRHFDYYLRVARESEDQLVGPEQFRYLDLLRNETDNFRAALATALESQPTGDALALAVALARFWVATDSFDEGELWLGAALERTDKGVDPELVARAQFERGKLLYGLDRYEDAEQACQGLRRTAEHTDRRSHWRNRAALIEARLHWRQGNFDAALSPLQAAASAFEAEGDLAGSAEANHILGHVLLDQGQTQSAHEMFQRSLEHYRQLGDRLETAALVGDLGLAAFFDHDLETAEGHFLETFEIYTEVGFQDGLAGSLNRLGDIARSRGDYGDAKELYRRSLELAKRTQYRAHIVSAEHNLGYCALAREDWPSALRRFERSLDIAAALDDRKGVAEAIAGVAAVSAAGDEPARAVALYAAAAELAGALGASAWPANQSETERRLIALRRELPEADFEDAWTRGLGWNFERALSEARLALDRLRAKLSIRGASHPAD